MSRGTVLITGASSGLGEEMARQFAALGYDLALCARRTDRLAALGEQITGAHPQLRIEIAALDVNDPGAVSRVFGEAAAALGGLDKVIVNAGLGKGAPVGTGGARANRETALTNVIGALNQTESAMEIFRAQSRNGRGGQLVLISSISALRGMRGTMTVYAATKSAVAALGEGVRAENVPGVDVTVIFPGYIESEMNPDPAANRLIVDTETGVRAIVAAIEKRKTKAYVPPWPWVPIGAALRVLPLSVVRRLT